VAENPWFSNYFIFSGKKDLWVLVKKLRRKKYDLIIDFKKSLLPFFLKGKFKITFFIKEFLSEKFYIHESERIMNFLEPFFGKGEFRLYFSIGNNYRERIKDFFNSIGIKSSDLIVVLSPGAKFPGRRWPKENFIQVGKELIRTYPVKIIITGFEYEIEITKEIKELIEEKGVFDITGKMNIKEIAAIFEYSDLVITNHNGLMHLACAVGANVVAIFGSGNPYRYGPIGNKSYIVHSEEDCFPCQRELKCKFGYKCIKNIKVSDVLKYCYFILDEKQYPRLFEI